MTHDTSRFRRLVLAAGIALVAAACSGAAGADDAAARPVPPAASALAAPTQDLTDPAPSTPFVLFDGSTSTFGDYRGQPLVVNFWASWCPSCVAEMSAAFRPVQAAIGNAVTFLGMNIQDRRDLAEELLTETGVEWISAEDRRGELYTKFGGLGMPFTVFISADGHIVERHNGPLSESQLRDKIAEVLGV